MDVPIMLWVIRHEMGKDFIEFVKKLIVQSFVITNRPGKTHMKRWILQNDTTIFNA